VPRADYDLATNRVTALEAEAQTRREAEITAAVDAAIEAGKVAPVSRDYHLATCRADGGLERFRAMVDASPVIAAKSTTTTPPNPTAKDGLSQDELAVCRQMGMSPADFAAAKAAQQE
jgi:phage I-like protein